MTALAKPILVARAVAAVTGVGAQEQAVKVIVAVQELHWLMSALAVAVAVKLAQVRMVLPILAVKVAQELLLILLGVRQLLLVIIIQELIGMPQVAVDQRQLVTTDQVLAAQVEILAVVAVMLR
jgi:hypothetical protein